MARWRSCCWLSVAAVLVVAGTASGVLSRRWAPYERTAITSGEDSLAASAAGVFVARIDQGGVVEVGRRVAGPGLAGEVRFRGLSARWQRAGRSASGPVLAAATNRRLAVAWSISNANDPGGDGACCEHSRFAVISPRGRVSQVPVAATPDELLVNSSGVSTWLINTGSAIEVWTFGGVRRIARKTLWRSPDGQATLTRAPGGAVLVVGELGYPQRVAVARVTSSGQILRPRTIGTYPRTSSGLGPDGDYFLAFRHQTVWLADGRVQVAVPMRRDIFRPVQYLGRSVDLLSGAQDAHGDAAVVWNSSRDDTERVATAARGKPFRRIANLPRPLLTSAQIVMDSTGRTVVFGENLDDQRLRHGDIYALTIAANGQVGKLVNLSRRRRPHACGFPEAQAAGNAIVISWTCFFGGHRAEMSILR